MLDDAGFEPVLHRAVASHARRQPHAIALIQGSDRVSYGSLDASADVLAESLRERGVARGQVVPLLLPRSLDLVVVQLAVLKCGAAYASLDVRWPAGRVAEILALVGPVLVVRGPAGDAAMDEILAGYHVLRISDLERSDGRMAPGIGQAAEPDLDDTGPADPAAAATVFFTSGTTGGPKGVLVPHQAVSRVFGPGGLPGFGPGHAAPQAAPMAWDMYAFELWGQLSTGGCAVLVAEDHLMPSTLRDLVMSAGVDTLWLTTSLFNLFVDEDPGCFAGLRQVLTGGETLSPEHVRTFLRAHPAIPLRNAYGPAENCMLTTTHLIAVSDCDNPGGIPVGSPVAGTQVVILDEDDMPVTPGAIGQICAAGRGLAIGYLGDAVMTAAKFPTVTIESAEVRIYRTGDVGMLDDHGVLHFRGRQDRQLKLSGYRIEPAEVEMVARSAPGVRECAVVPVTAADGRVTRLALFYVSDPGHADHAGSGGDPLAVRSFLAARLPGYMVPAITRRLDTFPITPNGKLDRVQLSRLAGQPRRTAAVS